MAASVLVNTHAPVSEPHRVHRITESSSGSPDATPSVNGFDTTERVSGVVVVDVVVGRLPETAGDPDSSSLHAAIAAAIVPARNQRRVSHPGLPSSIKNLSIMERGAAEVYRSGRQRRIRRYRGRVRHLWSTRAINAPAAELWRLLATPDEWPRWGPTVRTASVDGGQLALGSTGTVTTIAGVDLPFEITAFDEGARWAWNVGGITATDHTVDAIDARRCRVGFGVPWPAAPYLAVCAGALRRLDRLATGS